MKRPTVAILGAGIMGSSTALFLARRGAAVTLFDAAPAPFSCASRWNEGKIHLGFLYSSPVMKSEFTQFACGATMITSIAVSPCISAMMAMARSTSD